jgi:hypothetical protein
MKILQCTPDIRRFMNKINLVGWEENPIEKMYLEPLHLKFKELQRILWKLWFDGENFWKIPMYKNIELIEVIK